MGSVANVALAALKTSTELAKPNGELPGPRKKTARISELLLDGAAKDKLADLDSAAAADHDGLLRSPGSAAPASLAAVGSVAGSGSGGGSGSLQSAVSGNKWRKASKAVMVTKALAGRPKAGLAQGRPVQSLQAMREDKSANDLRRAASSGLGNQRKGVLDLRQLWAAAKENLLVNPLRLVIRPETRWYHVHWFYYAVLVAVLSCWVEPFSMAFSGLDGARTPVWMHVFEYTIIATFIMDFIFKFFVAYFDPETGMLVSEQPKMAFAYMKSLKFFLDVLGCFPYDVLVQAIGKSQGVSPSVTANLDWLKLMALTRTYRIFDLFHVLDYHMLLSQGTIMLLRNYIYVFFTCHWAACVFYHLAQMEGLSGDQSWVGRNAEAFVGKPNYEQYILSLYFSVTVFTAMGDARLYPFTQLELALMIVYLLFNLFLAAYIIGTVTIMMVQKDEHSKAFRESISHLVDYSRENELPDRLHKAMREHLEVHFDSVDTADDTVLGIYPTTIRRRALRHLYLQPIKGCYLFRGCKMRFLDALLTAARVELFLPGVEIITEGDNVVELLIVVAGEVSVTTGGARPVGNIYGSALSASAAGSNYAESIAGSEQSFARSRASQSFTSYIGGSQRLEGVSVDGAGEDPGAGKGVSPREVDVAPKAGPRLSHGSSVLKGSSDALGEVAFYTDGASYETVIGTTPVRVLSLPKAAWELLVQQFPQQVRVVLENVQRATEASVEENLKAAASKSQLTAGQLQVALSLINDQGGFADTDPMLLAQTRDALTQHQLDMITRLDDIRSVAAAHVRKCDEMRTFEFLNTAAMGDAESLRTMLSQGISPNTADYDGRTALMLSAAKGHDDTVRMLLNSGADMNKTDAFGISALAEAAKNAHDSTIELLLSFGATLGAGGLAVASEMCTAVYQSDLVKLRRLLRAGAPPDACDYDKRSALHIAGAEGNLEAVKLLVEEGGADPNFQDRWGNTALDEARRVSAAAVMTYLEGRQTRNASEAVEKRRQQVAHEFMGWCGQGDVNKLRQAGGYSYGEEAGCAFSGLLVASSKGHRDVVELLLEGLPPTVARQHGHVAMLEAARMGHPHTVAAFRAAGVALPDSQTVSIRYLAAEMRNAAQQGNGAVVEALMAAGVSCRLSASAGAGGAPIQLAVEHSQLGVTRRLVERGGVHADLSTVDGLGRTPLNLASSVLAKRPNDPRAKAVHEYLAWATPMAAGGASMVQIAAAAAERFGPIGFHGSVPASATVAGTGPAFSTVAALVGGNADPDGTALIGPPPAGGLSWEKGLQTSSSQGPRGPAVASPVRPSLQDGGNGGGSSLSQRGSGGPPPPSALRRASSGAPVAAGPNANDDAAVVSETWKQLPGTPGNSTRGGLRPAQTLRQLDATAIADAEAAYNASVQHSAALLNEPPGAVAAAAGSSAKLAGSASRHSLGAIPVGGSGAPSPLSRTASMNPGGGLASPSLHMPQGVGGLLSPRDSDTRLLLPPGGAAGGSSPYPNATAASGTNGPPGGISSPFQTFPRAGSAVGAALAVQSPRPAGSQASPGIGALGSPRGSVVLGPSSSVPVGDGSAVPAAASLGSAGPNNGRSAAARLFGDAAAAVAAAASSGGSMTAPEAVASAASLGAASLASTAANRALGAPGPRPQSPVVAPWRRSSVIVPVPEDDIEQYMGSLAPGAGTPSGEAGEGVRSQGSVTAPLTRLGSRLSVGGPVTQRSQHRRSSGLDGGLAAGSGSGASGVTSPLVLQGDLGPSTSAVTPPRLR